MPQDNWRRMIIDGFALGAVVGAFAAIVMPNDWSNLAFMPWFIVWFVFPSFIVFASICIVFGIDFISNGGANVHMLAALWVSSVAVVMGTYGLGLSVLVRRFREPDTRRE